MRTCDGKEIDKPVHIERQKEFQGHEYDEIYELFEAQRTAQGNHKTPRPLAVNPQYCRAYCEGFTIAKRIFTKK